MKINDPRYPIGKFEYGKSYSLDDTRKHIRSLARFPKDLKNTLKKLDRSDLDKAYRKGGWTVRQVVHHLADSHMNAYIRMKMAVTEPTPVIKPYDEKLWAETEDGKFSAIKPSLKLLSSLHHRWTTFLESLDEESLEKGYYHPASKRTVLLQEAIALYHWHCQHHLSHIKIVTGDVKVEDTKKSDKKTDAKKVTDAIKGNDQETGSKTSKKGTQAPAKPKKEKAAAKPKNDGPKMTREQVLEKARAARAAKKAAEAPAQAPAKPKKEKAAAKPKNDGPKMTREQVLEKARAARAAKSPAKAEKPKNDGPKMTREQVLEKARAARAAKSPAKAEKPKNDGPKMTREQVLEKARAARAAKKVENSAPAKPAKKAVAKKK